MEDGLNEDGVQEESVKEEGVKEEGVKKEGVKEGGVKQVRVKRRRGVMQRQEVAVREIGKGTEIVAVARKVGVSRQTIYRWLAEPGFVAAMNRWREATVMMARGQIVAGLGDAAATVVKAAREGNVRAAMMLLDKAGVFAAMADDRTDGRSIAREKKLRERADRAMNEKAEIDVVDVEQSNALRRALQAELPTSPIREKGEGGRERVKDVGVKEEGVKDQSVKEEVVEEEVARVAEAVALPVVGETPVVETPVSAEVTKAIAVKEPPRPFTDAEMKAWLKADREWHALNDPLPYEPDDGFVEIFREDHSGW